MQVINFIKKIGIALLALIVVLLGPAGAIIFITGRLISKLITGVLVKIGFNHTFRLIGISKNFCEGDRTPAHLISNIAAASVMIFTVIKVANYLGF
ncbi:MAG: hypothetical protein ABFD50_14815 [Smithella sp.]